MGGFFVALFNFSGFDIPLDAFSLHHPYLKTHLVEYEFSAWYFLFFTIFYQNTTEETKTVDVSLLVPELNQALASKLSVPATVIKIAKAEKYRSEVAVFTILDNDVWSVKKSSSGFI